MNKQKDNWPERKRPPVHCTSHVHLWRVDLSRHRAFLEEYAMLLHAEERERAARFRLEDDRCRSMVGRGALRILLAAYTGGNPRDLELKTTPNGKPVLAEETPHAVRWGVSHSGDMVLCGFSREGDIGVDVEHIRTHTDYQKLTARFFSSVETDWLCALPESRRLRAFYELWVCKEAVIKALGGGLSVPLDSFSILFSSTGHGVRVKFNDEMTPVKMALCLLYPAADYPAAVACLKDTPLEPETYSLAIPDGKAFDET